MPFSTAELTQLEALVGPSDGGPQVAAQFRAQFPGKSLTRCDASDMGAEEPFRRFAAVDLYLIDAHDHCVQITADPNQATGVVIAKRKQA